LVFDVYQNSSYGSAHEPFLCYPVPHQRCKRAYCSTFLQQQEKVVKFQKRKSSTMHLQWLQPPPLLPLPLPSQAQSTSTINKHKQQAQTTSTTTSKNQESTYTAA